MTRIVWTSPHYASLMAERIVESVERLQEFPRSGRVVPEVGQEVCREVILGTYRIVYRLEGDRADILTVVHAAGCWERGWPVRGACRFQRRPNVLQWTRARRRLRSVKRSRGARR